MIGLALLDVVESSFHVTASLRKIGQFHISVSVTGLFANNLLVLFRSFTDSICFVVAASQIELNGDAKGQNTLVFRTLCIDSEQLITVCKSFFKHFLSIAITKCNVLKHENSEVVENLRGNDCLASFTVHGR